MKRNPSEKLKTVVTVDFRPSEAVKLPVFVSQPTFRALYRFTDMRMDEAFDLVKCGQKDSARHWVRYIRNANVIEILSDAGLPLDVASELTAKLRTLESQCDPEDVPNFQSDLQAIRVHLETIITRLSVSLEIAA